MIYTNKPGLIEEISRAKEEVDDHQLGLSVSRRIDDDNMAIWEVQLCTNQLMTVICSEVDYKNVNDDDIASIILGCWNSEWDDK